MKFENLIHFHFLNSPIRFKNLYMPSKKGSVHALRLELRSALNDQDTASRKQEEVPDISQSEETSSHDDNEIVSQSIFGTKGTSPSALKIGDSYPLIDPEDLKIGMRSLAILNQVPRYKGISSRVPEFFAIESKNRTRVSLVPHMRAITMLIHSFMATKIYSNNISIEVRQTVIYIHSLTRLTGPYRKKTGSSGRVLNKARATQNISKP